MNAAQVCNALSKSIQAVEAWRKALDQSPKEAQAAEEMFIRCYPERRKLIESFRPRGD